MVYHDLDILYLFLSRLFTHLITLIFNIYYLRPIVKFNIFLNFNIKREVILSAFTFTLIGFLNRLTTNVDLIMISLLGESQDVGIYGAPYKIAQQGVVFRNYVAIAFFPIIVKKIKSSNIDTNNYINLLLRISVLSLILCLIGISLSKHLIQFLYGEEFESSVFIFKY